MRLKAFILLLMFSLGAAGLVHALSGTLFSDVITDGGCEGAFFDLRAESQDLTIIGFETVLVGTANVRVYYKPGTYAGSETNAGAWTLLGSQTITGGSGFIQTLYPVNVGPVLIPAGQTYGFLIYSGNGGSGVLATRYRVGSPVNVSDGELRLSGGTAPCAGDRLNNPFDGLVMEGGVPGMRAWRGKVHYATIDGPITFTDGRINRRDPAAAFAVYPHSDASGGLGLVIYDAYADRLLLEVTAAQIAAVPERPAENSLIAASPDGRVSLYRLFDGQFQAMGPAASGKQYGVIFPEISSGAEYRSFEE
jgi:hypothetical protein